MKRMILVAGGAGYIGSHVNKLLNRRGRETVVFDSLIYGHREFVKWGQFFRGDLADREALRSCLRQYPVDAVMHFCAFACAGESVVDPGKYYVNNVANTLNLLEVMREFEVKRFIFSSSCAVYGIPEKIPIIEDHPRKPVNPYGRTKLMVEKILEDYDLAYGLKHVNLRYFNAAGADPEGEIGELHEPETHLIPLTIYAALGINERVGIFGTDYPTPDGTCVRDYIHVNDLASAHVKAIERLESTGKSDSFNLGNGNGYSVRQIIDMVKRVSGKEFETIETERREGDPPVLVGSSAVAERLLGWKPELTDIQVIIETAWKWHEKNRK